MSNLSGNLNKLFRAGDDEPDHESFFMEFPQDAEDLPAPLMARGPVPQVLLAVFDHLPVLVNAVNIQDEVFTFWNREAELVTGYSARKWLVTPRVGNCSTPMLPTSPVKGRSGRRWGGIFGTSSGR